MHVLTPPVTRLLRRLQCEMLGWWSQHMAQVEPAHGAADSVQQPRSGAWCSVALWSWKSEIAVVVLVCFILVSRQRAAGRLETGSGTPREREAGAPLATARRVRNTPSWPRSWASSCLLSLCSHRNAWANWHLLGQPNAVLALGALFRRVDEQHHHIRQPEGSGSGAREFSSSSDVAHPSTTTPNAHRFHTISHQI